MCGIMAYIGKEQAYPIVIDGLKKLEYRGYDSTGVAIMNGSLSVYKKKGKVSDLQSYIGIQKKNGYVAMGHTRWATHGIANDVNAHPHLSKDQRLVMVHNGIIENHNQLKSHLSSQGYHFVSDTDSEVLLQHIEWYRATFSICLLEAVRRALGDVQGSYALVIMDTYDPENIVVAKKDTPLAIGLCTSGFYCASDASAIPCNIEDIMFLEDGNIGLLNLHGSRTIINLDNEEISIELSKLNRDDEVYDKGAYDTYMLKEIFSQPETIRRCIEGRNTLAIDGLYLQELSEHLQRLSDINRVIITGCGTSWHAGLIGEYMIEDIARISVEVEYASEFRYRNPIITDKDLVIAISQSGETADTLAALQLAKEKGALTYSIVNRRNSSIGRLSNIESNIRTGIEIGVASTKAFTGQVTFLALLALQLAQLNGTRKNNEISEMLDELSLMPSFVQEALNCQAVCDQVGRYLSRYDHALFLGRGINFPTALEGALKLKEISYIHAEGYPAAEMKHGPIALIDENMPIVVVATNDSCHDKLISNIQETRSRKGKIILIASQGQNIDPKLYDFIIELPEVADFLSPIQSVIPLQLISYYAAKYRDCNIDQPRNLAKSVTVE